jgi:hypothetical protein
MEELREEGEAFMQVAGGHYSVLFSKGVVLKYPARLSIVLPVTVAGYAASQFPLIQPANNVHCGGMMRMSAENRSMGRGLGSKRAAQRK